MPSARASRSHSRPRKHAEPTAPAPRRPLWKRVALAGAWLCLGIAAGFLLPYFWAVDRWLQHEFGRLSWREPTRVYARPLPLAAGQPMQADALLAELSASGYRENGLGPGSYRREGDRWVVHSRAFSDLEQAHAPRQLSLRLQGGRIRDLRDDRGQAVASALIDPARIATFYGNEREERRLVELRAVPPLLIATLQVVEDRSFKTHAGVDLWGVIRAAWTNLRAGEVRQGGSTLTQQLVRNLYLSREQSFWRKLREAAYALVIEARFDKARILEVYLNQVYLGQQGSQAVHGVAAGAEFWFGRELAQLDVAETALLVGLIQGPSLLDPRRHPQRALARRNRVLEQLVETGVLPAAELAVAQSKPLGVTAVSGLRVNRHPAFLDLVHAQLARDYPADRLNGQGLQVLTTLAPMAQQAAEKAVRDQLPALRKQSKDLPVEAAMVVSDTRSGEVVAVVGALQSTALGFNRALEARRPVGSLLKPFVYLLALAQPGRYSLATLVEDAPIRLRVSGGRTWEPENADRRSHGWVSLAQALAQSYNQATVRLGMEIGPERLARLIEVLGAPATPAHPSLLLGSVDLTPMQVTQLYQFLAAGGQVQPLRAVRGVLDGDGRPLSRYTHALADADPGDAIAARLVTLALQGAARDGTARRLQQDGLAWLQPAGKTGTSNDSRDSWFAGWTGDHLAVAWVGDDRNRPTGLSGSAGAMRLWAALFRELPSVPLRVDERGLERAWIAAEGEWRTDPECEGAREVVFVAGYSPLDHRGCTLTRLRNWFGAGERRDAP